MKIALFSDIHANLPAFEAAMASIDAHKPDAVYCLGDLVGYNVWPNEVINEIRKRGIVTIGGNHDAKVGGLTEAKPAEPGKNYAYTIIEPGHKQYLATLPAYIRVEFILNNQPLNLLLVHGSPTSNTEYLLEDKEESAFLDVFKASNADILCFGHSHKPYHRVITETTANGLHHRHAINIGSVGKPKDGDARGCYVLLTINSFSNTKVAESIDVEFIRVAYDVEKAAAAVEASPLPIEFADMLRRAY
ncbi:MAG TPA: metallophosphoesterase family protein [Chitinophagaceae bacterium]|nr:metallophosphoesterase family protein [Chitinophagaceae bacterium]